jgi:hypothetical protein
MADQSRSWTVNNWSHASNPGNVPVNLFRWFHYYPKWPLIWFSSLAASVAMACVVDPYLWIVAGLLLCWNLLYWQRVREHFRNGCACPAVIVSMEPMLIAVATDLSKGDGEYPAIKIIEKSLPTVCGQIPQAGSQLATVALYDSSSYHIPYWADFDPRPVECATGELDVIERVMKTFARKDWNELYSWLDQVPQPYRCGLYHVEPTGQGEDEDEDDAFD